MAQYLIQLLGSPTAQTVIGDKAFGLNGSGVAVGVAHIPEARAVMWIPGPDTLPLLGLNSVAYAVNDSGHIVGAWGNNALPENIEIDPVTGPAGQAFLYRNGEMNDLGNVFGAQVSVATDINKNGLIAAWAGDIGNPHAFLYDSQAGSVPKDLGVLPGYNASRAMALNNKGNVVGILTKNAPDSPHAFLYEGNLVDLGPDTYAYDINEQREVVGERLVSPPANWSAFLCETSSGSLQFTDLGHLQKTGFVGSVARSINNHGDIVGDSFTPYGVGLNGLPKMSRAFLRPGPAGGPGDLLAGQMLDLNDLIPPNSGWLLHWAMAINDSRRIVGVGTYNGQYRAYLLTPESDFRPGGMYEVAIDPLALILSYDLYVKINLPRPIPVLTDTLIDRIRKEVQAMGAGERRNALARLKALSVLTRAVEEELSKL
jgi:probable HAF family extracellular repeat protein